MRKSANYKGGSFMNENLYYIMDTYGCYYGVNKNSKIMAISNKDYATKSDLIHWTRTGTDT